MSWRESDDQHTTYGECHEYQDAYWVRDEVDKVRRGQFGHEGRYDVGKEDDSFGETGTDEIERCRQDDYVEDIIDQACHNRALVQLLR